ncbi:hypothetical protein OHA74_54315 [Streptomyces phaeochromogenes]|uniref:hypothetical protein n=1 Tax=Streptomyces phaeochromogenes TaxID=1923 RepID=UPI002E2DF7E4|nr:hypothetical protein [Streptomyces phaeochromogenes]
MTEQRADAAPPADPATAYLEALRRRLTADGCTLTSETWAGHLVVVGSRSDRKARWIGTKFQLFVYGAVVPQIDETAIAEFTNWALANAKRRRGGVPGARNVPTALPALISTNVHPPAAQWATANGHVMGAPVVARPVTVETTPEAVRTTMYRGRVIYGGLFTSHVLEKAALYFP